MSESELLRLTVRGIRRRLFVESDPHLTVWIRFWEFATIMEAADAFIRTTSQIISTSLVITAPNDKVLGHRVESAVADLIKGCRDAWLFVWASVG